MHECGQKNSLSSCGLSLIHLGASFVLSLMVRVVVSQEPLSRNVPFLLNPMLAPESVCAGRKGDGQAWGGGGGGGVLLILKLHFTLFAEIIGYLGCPGTLWSLPVASLLLPLILKYPELDSSWGDTLWSVHRPGG